MVTMVTIVQRNHGYCGTTSPWLLRKAHNKVKVVFNEMYRNVFSITLHKKLYLRIFTHMNQYDS